MSEVDTKTLTKPREKKATYSFTALSRYLQCSELYRLWYLDPTSPKPEGKDFDQLVGIVLHEILERYYKQERNIHKQFKQYWLDYFIKYEHPTFVRLLDSYATDYLSLLERASKDYQGADAIRDRQGRVARVPKRTSAWTRASDDLKLEERRLHVDRAIGLKDLDYKVTSVADVYAESWDILRNYAHPKDITEIVSVEEKIWVTFPFSQKQVVVKIDLVGRFKDGALIIGDHKSTSKHSTDAYKVSHTAQLLFYGWAWHEKYGVYPDYIGLNYLRGGYMVATPFSEDRALQVVMRQEQIIAGIEANVFIPNHPSDFTQSCFKDYSGQACHFLSVCHPSYYRAVMDRIEGN